MSGKAKRVVTIPLAAFWDTSALVPLCCYQSQSSQATRSGRLYSRRTVWWATYIEAVSSFNRLFRHQDLTREGLDQALARIERLRQSWNEVQPTDEVRSIASRLLGVHKLRAADALQLAAALVWCRQRPRGRHFIAADGDLSSAAEREGFSSILL